MRFWEANMRTFLRPLTGRSAPVCGEIRSKPALRAICRGFRSLPCRGARRGFIMTRSPGPAYRRITRRGFIICRSRAPWPRRACWMRSPASGYSTSAPRPAARQRSWPPPCRAVACSFAMRSIRAARRCSPQTSSGSAFRTPLCSASIRQNWPSASPAILTASLSTPPAPARACSGRRRPP